MPQNQQKRAIRVRKFNSQLGCCFYCGISMWDRALETPHTALARLTRVEISPNQSFSKPQRKLLRLRLCTLEHLKRKVDGGKNHHANLVVACNRCNSQRHEMPWEEYLELVKKLFDTQSAPV